MSSCGLHCLKIEHIGVSRGEHEILHDVNLHAHCGEITTIIGRNGAGKSTLLKAILNEVPHTGSVTFSGHNGKPSQKRPRIGYVPQSLNIEAASPSTVYDMAMAFTSLYPSFLPRRRKTVEALCTHFARFGADSLLDKQAGRLSGGELQRVLLALATLPTPDLLIMDEPVSGVDADGLAAFYERIDRLRTDDMVILLVSHDLAFARSFSNRVVLLDHTVKAAGTPDEVFSSQAFATAFPREEGFHA